MILCFYFNKNNLNPYFGKGKDRYSEFRNKLAQEVENFEKRHNIKHGPAEEEKYVTEFKHLLESYGRDSSAVTSLEKIKHYLITNH